MVDADNVFTDMEYGEEIKKSDNFDFETAPSLWAASLWDCLVQFLCMPASLGLFLTKPQVWFIF